MSEDTQPDNGNGDEKKIPEADLLPVPTSIDERRRRVKEMMLRGIPTRIMARNLGVSEDTIRKDQKAVKVELRNKYRDFDIKTGLGECADALDMIARRSALEAERTKNKRQRNAFLNTSIRAWVAKAHVLSDPGVLPTTINGLSRAVTRIEDGDYEPTVKRVINNPESRRRLLGVLDKVIRNAKPAIIKDAEVIKEPETKQDEAE